MNDSRARCAVAFCLLLTTCRSPRPTPPPIPSPPSEEQVKFSWALFSIYHRAHLAAHHTDAAMEPLPLKEAASIVAKGAPRFGQVWLVLAITQLAASDIHAKGFRDAIAELAGKPTAPRTLRHLLAEHPSLELLEREKLVYDFLLGDSTFLVLDPGGLPTCPHTYPTATATSQFGVTVGTVTAVVQKSVADIAVNMDPQNWDNPCGKLFFNATYLSDLKSNGTFDIDSNFNAAEGTPETVGTAWGPRYLFEHYLIPSVGGDYFKNILSVETAKTSNSYFVKTYSLEASIRSRIAPDEQPGGLFTDEGNASATETGNTTGTGSTWTLIQGTKTVRYMDFPHHASADLADAAATTFKMAGNGFVYWLCCPK